MRSYLSSEKKLQLVRRIRQEHQLNRNTIRGREAFLHGRDTAYEDYQDGYLNPGTEREAGEIPVSTFRLRMAAAFLLFGIFYLAVSNERPFFGIDVSRVYEAVAADYSPVLFDFMGKIPYTLHRPE